MADENGGAPVDAPEGAGAASGQPDGGGNHADLYAKYVAQAPPEIRDSLSEALHGYSREAVEPKFREHAEYRQQWAPYEEAGINNASPEDLAEGYYLYQLFANPEQALADPDIAQTLQGNEEFEQQWQAIGEQLGYFEDDEDEDEGDGALEDNPQLQAILQRLEQQDERLNAFLGQNEQQQRDQQTAQRIDAELGELQQQHNNGEKFDEKFEHAMYRLALTYEGEEQPLHKAFEELQQLSGQAQSELVQSKLDQPAPANGNGQPTSKPPEFHSVADAREAALARLKAA